MSNRQLVVLGLGVLGLVVLATAAILWASAATKTKYIVDTNTPSLVPSSTTTTYTETADIPALSRKAPAKSEPASQQTVSTTISLQCVSSCTGGTYTGFGGKFTLSVSGPDLEGTLQASCQEDSLLLTSPSVITAPAKLPQTFTGILTRTSTCSSTHVASPVKLELRAP